MENLQQITGLSAWIETLTTIRKKGPEGEIKRRDIRDYIDRLPGVKISSFPIHISYGYFERLLRKAASEKTGIQVGSLFLDQYSEGCGFFYGTLALEKEGGVKETISFSWEGKGAIEETWDMFGQWDTAGAANG